MQTISSLEGKTIFHLSQLLTPESIPGDIVQFNLPLTELFDHVFYTNISLQTLENGYGGKISIIIDKEISIAPFGEIVELLIAAENGVSLFDIEVSLESQPGGFVFNLSLLEVPIILRIPATILRPVISGTSTPDMEANSLDVELGAITLDIGTHEPLNLDVVGSPIVPPCIIGNTGIILSIFGFRWITPGSDNLPLNTPLEFNGLYLESISIELPDDISNVLPSDVQLLDFFIGSSGFSGIISGDWQADPNNPFDADSGDFFGFRFKLTNIAIEFKQSTLVSGKMVGFLELPFFDVTLEVELTITNDGDFTIALADPNGLLTLEKENVISIDVTSLEFIKEESTFSVKLTGEITPLLADLDWPSFELKGLTISSDGTVKVEGGWIELPDQKALDFHGFQIEIAQLGFGSDEIDGQLYKWVGFSGGIQIVQSLPMRGGVEGLKVMWTEDGDFNLKIGGVYLSFEVKDVLTFDGSVFFIDEEDKKEFRGSVDLSLIPINLGVDAQFITGKTSDYNYFYIAVDLDLPIGIPLGPPVLGLYGLAGLFGHNMTLDYQDLINYEGVENRPELTDVGNWNNQKGAMAFGAGLTVGTLPDSKFIVKAKALFVILIPGPVLLIEGHAGMLSVNDNFMMQVLAVLDPASGTYLLNISAGYQFPNPSGELLNVSGSAEAFFSTADPSSWHLYLGENKPESKRIRADILNFFKADTYLMVENDGFIMGAWIGYGLNEKYGVLKVVLEAWMSGELSLSTMPLQAKGSVTLYGNAELSASIVKLGISVEANVAAQAPKPIGISASLKVQLKTPVGKPKATIKLNWEKTGEPPYPIPLSATLGIEHRKVAENWDISKSSTYQLDDDGLYTGSNSGATSFGNIPVVPPDVYMVLNFDKPVNDGLLGFDRLDNDGSVGSNPVQYADNEKIGDYKFKYDLTGVTLEYRDEWDETDDGGTWEDYAIFAANLVNEGLSEYKLTGVWQAIPGEDDMANTKLVLNSSTPFEISRLLDEKAIWYGMMDVYNPNYPCISVPDLEEICVDFENRDRGYYYGVLEQDKYLFSSPYPMIVSGYEAPWLGTSNALINADNFETIVCLNIKAEAETKQINLKTIKKVLFTAGIGYDSYLQLTNEHSNKDVELYVNSSQVDLANGIIPVFIHFPKPSFPGTPFKVWITCIVGDTSDTLFYAFDEDGTEVDRVSHTEGVNVNGAVQYELTSDGGAIRKIGMLGWGIRIIDICYEINHPVQNMNILVTAPEDIIKADLHLSKHSNGTIYVYDEENKEVQQVPFDIPGDISDEEVLPIIIETQSQDPFRSFLVKGWFDIIRVCGVTQEAQDIYDYNANLDTLLQESLEENWGKHTEQILYPNKYYRLKIVTTTSRKKNKGDWEPEEFIEYMYFKTGNPPGPIAETQDEVGTDPKNRYDLEGPLSNLSAYVDYTIPAAANADDEQSKVYRSYDVGVAYNDSYIDQMYQMAGLPIKIRLLDNNNLSVLDAKGKDLEFVNLWGDNPELSLTEEETIYADVLDDSGCIIMVSEDVETNEMTIGFSRDLLMKPQTQYKAQVIAGENAIIYEFSFITSRYANFLHHIHSFEDAIWNHFQLVNNAAYSIDALLLEQLLNNGEVEQVQFESLMDHFDLNPRMVPERLEITLVNDSNTSFGLLMESPEPIDWLRTELQLSHSPTMDVVEAHTERVKIIGGSLASSQWIDILILESTDLTDWILQYKDPNETDEVEDLQYFQFPAGEVYNAGVHIRIHNGQKPLVTTGETEKVNLYAENATETLPTNGSQLLIKNADGELLHQRIIQSASTMFSQKDITLIKNEDESKCFIFVNDGSQIFSSLERGLYRLDFTYHRDIGGDNPKLTRFGFGGNEEATIEFSLPTFLPDNV